MYYKYYSTKQPWVYYIAKLISVHRDTYFGIVLYSNAREDLIGRRFHTLKRICTSVSVDAIPYRYM